MAYKARIVTCSTPAQLMKNVKEVMLACGWIDKTPTGQDDPNGYALGIFLQSPGESGNELLHLHLAVLDCPTAGNIHFSQLFAKYAYLSGPINDTTDTIAVDAVGAYTAPGVVQIDDEAVYYTGVNVGGLQLTGCVRGWGVTDPVSHSSGAVVQVQLNNTNVFNYLAIETYGFRDLTKDLFTSSETASMTKVGPASWASLGGYGTDRFAFHALLKISDGAEAGKMRWVTAYTSTGGAFSYQPFLNAPGTVHAKVVGGGYFPAWSKRSTYVSAQSRYPGYIDMFAAVVGQICFIYASLDGVIVIRKDATCYQYHFFGNAIRPHASNTTRLTKNSLRTLAFGAYTNCVMTDIGKPVVGGTSGDTGVLVAFNNTAKTWKVAPDSTVNDTFPSVEVITITGGTGTGTTSGASVKNGFAVSNINLIAKDQKYRIMTQIVEDWEDNRTPGGSWPVLDVEESAMEEIIALDILPETRTLVLASAGYISCIGGDVGKLVTGAVTGDTGYLQSYNNITREWVVVPVDSGDEFDVAEPVTTIAGGGTGAGATTGASTNSTTGCFLTGTLNYTYRGNSVTPAENAILGEDPRPVCRVALGAQSNALYSASRFLPVYFPCLGTQLAAHASQRQTYRAFHLTANQYAPSPSSGDSYVRSSALSIDQGNTYSRVANRQVDQIAYSLYELTLGTVETTPATFGMYNAIKGFIPMTWKLPTVASGGVSGEDIVKTVWNGKYEKFRVFYDNNVSSDAWFACGPEILV